MCCHTLQQLVKSLIQNQGISICVEWQIIIYIANGFILFVRYMIEYIFSQEYHCCIKFAKFAKHFVIKNVLNSISFSEIAVFFVEMWLN